METIKKLSVLVLAVIMTVCFIPAMAFADDTTTDTSSDATTTTEAVAQVGSTTYDTLPEAVAAATDGDTVTLLKDASGSGVKISAENAKQITIDFGGNTYTMDETAVGSEGYESQAMHFEKGSDITLKDGTLKVMNNAATGVQNYADLTLDDFTIDASEDTNCSYGIGGNNGDISIEGSSSIKMADGKNAFDVCLTDNYPDGANVTVDTTGTIDGDIAYDTWNGDGEGIPSTNNTSLEIKNGTFTGSIDVEDGLESYAAAVITVTGGTFAEEVSGTYLPTGYASVKNSDGTFTVTNVSESQTELDEANSTITDLNAALKKALTPSKTSLKLYKGKSKFTAKWYKITDTTGYELKYSTSKKFTSKSTHIKYIKTYKTTKITFNKYVKSKKTYYVKIRTYKQYNGKKYYSGWSSVKSVKTK